MAKCLCIHLRSWSINIKGIGKKHIYLSNGFRHEGRAYSTESYKENILDENDISSKENEKEKRCDGMKKQILAASLPFVNSHGWSKKALSAGAESVGFSGVAHGMFPRGGAELVEYFYHVSNEALVIDLTQLAKEYEKEISEKGIPSKDVMIGGVESRLKMIIPYKERWPEALALMTLPPNIPTALANLLTIVDDVCYYAGDRSVNMNWYGRRLALAGIYKTTELYMLSDTSPQHTKTWQFLQRRIDDAIQLEGILKNSESAGIFAKDFAAATFTAARNILGLNWNR